MIFPNPFTSEISLSTNLQIASYYRLEFYNGLGQLVDKQDYHFRKGQAEVKLVQLSNQSSGIYHVKMVDLSTQAVSSYKVLKLE